LVPLPLDILAEQIESKKINILIKKLKKPARKKLSCPVKTPSVNAIHAHVNQFVNVATRKSPRKKIKNPSAKIVNANVIHVNAHPSANVEREDRQEVHAQVQAQVQAQNLVLEKKVPAIAIAIVLDQEMAWGKV
jgi:D-alanyl-D-alanine carboxypeptidase